MRNRQRGFTLIELLLVLFIFVGIIGCGFFGLSRANCWYRESQVLRELRITHPEAVEILKTERNLVSYSEITVRNQDGSTSVYKLDSNILFNYHFVN